MTGWLPVNISTTVIKETLAHNFKRTLTLTLEKIRYFCSQESLREGPILLLNLLQTSVKELQHFYQECWSLLNLTCLNFFTLNSFKNWLKILKEAIMEKFFFGKQGIKGVTYYEGFSVFIPN